MSEYIKVFDLSRVVTVEISEAVREKFANYKHVDQPNQRQSFPPEVICGKPRLRTDRKVGAWSIPSYS